MSPIVRHAVRRPQGGWLTARRRCPRPSAGRSPAMPSPPRRRSERMAAMTGQLHSDAPDAHALATSYAGLLGMEVHGEPGDDWQKDADPVRHPCCLVWDVP